VKAYHTRAYALQIARANKRYHAHYDNYLFTLAARDRRIERTNALLDTALALCGHPTYHVDRTEWNTAEWAFLACFEEL